ncbi:hypothetical protein JCM9279_002018, partial [Rhodotorula babjevae]
PGGSAAAGTSTPKAAGGFNLLGAVNTLGQKTMQTKTATPQGAKRPNESRIVKDTAPKKTRDELEREWGARRARERAEREKADKALKLGVIPRLDLLEHVRGLASFELALRPEVNARQNAENEKYRGRHPLPRLSHFGSVFSLFPRRLGDEEELGESGKRS